LRGSKAKKIIENGADQLSVYGIGKEHSKEQWKRLALQLLQHGLLNRDSQHGSLRLTRRGWAVLRSKEQFQGVPVNPADEIAEAPNTHDVTTKESNEYSHELFEQLRATRRELSEAENVPSYVVFHDKTLQEMAAQLPQSVDTFTQIPGVGTAKVQKYADVFLPIICTYCQEHGLMAENR
jgi:ATP-dependent DNA helicase RecQ